MNIGSFTAIVIALAIVLSLSASAEGSVINDRIEAGDHTFTKVTDYLFEATYDDYEQYRADADAFFVKYNPKRLGGCSSVQNGMIRGRNYDWRTTRSRSS